MALALALASAMVAGVCDEDADSCRILPINEGQPCTQGNLCTRNDVCDAGACVSIAYSELDSGVLVALVWIFVAARLAHTITYAYAIQPWRTVTYSVGATSMIVAAISLFWAG